MMHALVRAALPVPTGLNVLNRSVDSFSSGFSTAGGTYATLVLVAYGRCYGELRHDG